MDAPQPADDHGRRAPVVRLFLAIFLPSVVVLAGLIAALFLHERQRDRLSHVQTAAFAVDQLADIVERELDTVVSDLTFLANQPDLLRLANGEPELEADVAAQYRLFSGYRGLYDQIRYLDTEGKEIIRINFAGGVAEIVPADKLQPKGDRYYVQGTLALKPGQVFMSPLDLNVEEGRIEQPIKPVIRFATPITDAAGKQRGIVVLNYLGANLLEKVRKLSETYPGDVYLLNPQGYYLSGPDRESEWGLELKHARSFISDFRDVWPLVLTAKDQEVAAREGLLHVRSLPLSASAWHEASAPADPSGADSAAQTAAPRLLLVSHVPPDVAYEPSNRLLQRFSAVASAAAIVIALLAWYAAGSIVHRRRQDERLRASEGRLRTLSLELMNAQEAERRRLARDLHDELGQIATAVRLNLNQARTEAAQGPAAESIERASENSRVLLDRIREIATALRPPVLDDLELKDAVQSCLREFERNLGLDVSADIDIQRSDVPGDIKNQVYRILQEALCNVSRHAGSSQAHVALQCHHGELTLKVRDQGTGFDANRKQGGLGLLTMRERAELLGGDFRLSSRPGEGTEVEVSIPLA